MSDGCTGTTPPIEGFFIIMKYQLSENKYPKKPSDYEFSKMRWVDKESDLIDLSNFLEQGYVFRNVFDSTSNKGKKTFISSQIIFLDVENSGEEPPELETFLSISKLKPSLYYRTYNGLEKNRYRLAYVLDKTIENPSEFKAITKAIINYTGCLSEKMVDQKSWSCYQNICGTNSPVQITYKGYRLKDLHIIADKFIEKDSEVKLGKKLDYKLSYEQYDLLKDYTQPDGTFESWVRDNKNLPLLFESFPDREDETYFYYDNYICLFRKLFNGSYFHKKGDRFLPNTFHDGEHRRKKIKCNCSLIHQIYPTCSLKELLTLTTEMFLILFSNDKEDKISREFIFDTVIREYLFPLGVESPVKIKKRFKVKQYKDGKRIHWKVQSKNYYKDFLFNLFDFSLTVEQNKEIINSFLSKTMDDFRFNDRLIKKYLDEENIFYLSDKPITTLKKMIEHKFSKDDCLKFLLEHKKEIGKNQITKYKLIIDKIK